MAAKVVARCNQDAVGVLPNLSIVIHNRKAGHHGFEKILISLGSNSDQIFKPETVLKRFPAHQTEYQR